MRRAVTYIRYNGVRYEPGQDLPDDMSVEELLRLVALGSATSDEKVEVVNLTDFGELV